MKARPTILGLMGVIAFVAVGIAALRNDDGLSAAVIFALTVSALCTASLIAFYRRGAWAGFAVFGWAQFVICQPNSPSTVGPTSFSMGIAYRLLCSVNTETRDPAVSFTPGFPTIRLDDWDGTPSLEIRSPTGRSSLLVGKVPIHSLCVGLCLSSIIVGFPRCHRRWPHRSPLRRQAR
jgi:hypothetical protein